MPGAKNAKRKPSSAKPAMRTSQAETTSIGQWTPVDNLVPWDKNPRANDDAVPGVVASIRQFGFIAPVLVWTSKGRMVGGHTRLKAMRALLADDATFVPAGAPGPGLVPVRFHEFRNEHEANLYALADNKLAERAQWDDELLEEVASDYDEEELGLAGFDDDEVADLIGEEDDEPPKDSGHAVTRALGSWRLEQRDLRVADALAGFEDASFDGVVCDPPYGLSPDGKARTWDDVAALRGAKRGKGFMGKQWDDSVPGPTFWAQVLRVLKPGARVLAFGGTRTYHRLAAAIEDAGFDIDDQIDWLYGQGYPKNATQLKPMHEPVCLAQKPLDGTVAQNLAKHGIGALNIAGARIETDEPIGAGPSGKGAWFHGKGKSGRGPKPGAMQTDGRWPGNVVLDEEASRALASRGIGVGDEEGASRFFYVAKVSKAERDAGLRRKAKNPHPTLKPVSLARHLATLVLPPEGHGTRKLLIPFSGSGSEMIGALLAGWDDVTGLEQSAEYIEIARARVSFAVANPQAFDVDDEQEAEEAAE